MMDRRTEPHGARSTWRPRIEAIPLKTLTEAAPALRLRSLPALVALAICGLLAFATPAFAATYDALDVIPYDTWRASASMSQADIQAFLEALPGPLKSVVSTDYAGVKKPASQIIWEASRAWNLNPKIVLATLQKEQSLLTVSNTSNAARLIKAMGCGVYGTDPVTGKTINRYPGFGKQVWNGARVLSTYEITYHWFPGKSKTVTAYKTVDGKRISYSKTIVPKNASTFALYTYTPYYPQKLVWDIYLRYFGDPHAAPRLRPVYRFKHRTTGAYFYTASEGTRYNMIAGSSSSWVYGGVAYTIDTSSTVNTKPVYRLRNTKTKRYAYTPYASSRDRLLAISPRTWVLSGTVGSVSTTAGTGTPVYHLVNKRTRGILLTPYLSTRTRLTTGSGATFYYKGIAFYLGHSEPTSTPVGP